MAPHYMDPDGWKSSSDPAPPSPPDVEPLPDEEVYTDIEIAEFQHTLERWGWTSKHDAKCATMLRQLRAALARAAEERHEAKAARDRLQADADRYLEAFGPYCGPGETVVAVAEGIAWEHADLRRLLAFAGELLDSDGYRDPMDIGERHGLVKTLFAGADDETWAFTPLGARAVAAAREAGNG